MFIQSYRSFLTPLFMVTLYWTSLYWEVLIIFLSTPIYTHQGDRMTIVLHCMVKVELTSWHLTAVSGLWTKHCAFEKCHPYFQEILCSKCNWYFTPNNELQRSDLFFIFNFSLFPLFYDLCGDVLFWFDELHTLFSFNSILLYSILRTLQHKKGSK